MILLTASQFSCILKCEVRDLNPPFVLDSSNPFLGIEPTIPLSRFDIYHFSDLCGDNKNSSGILKFRRYY